jgi:hypothetical protein
LPELTRLARALLPTLICKGEKTDAGHAYPEEEADMAKEFDELTRAFEFGNTYPGFAPVSAEQGSTTSGAVAPSQLQQTVTQALQGVLGRTFKQGDVRSFRAALEVSFEYKEVGGRSTYEWRPRAYPSRGATDMGGGISGAQYSLVSFATGLYEKTLPLIQQLTSLVPDADPEEVEAAKAIYLSVWTELIGELSREGGPRAPRANELSKGIFDKLSNKSAAGHLVRLGRLLGMIKIDKDERAILSDGRINFTRERVVRQEEEGNLTMFISVSDYFLAVDRSWDNYRNNFFQQDLGTGLLMLERQLSVLEESINEVYVAMDSVFVDQAQRLAILIDFEEFKDVSIEDFLSWIASFASTEAPGLIREGGKWGVEAILPTARTLQNLVGQFISRIKAIDEYWPSSDAPAQREATTQKDDKDEAEELTLPPAFNHGRVLNPLSEVQLYLGQVISTARKIT